MVAKSKAKTCKNKKALANVQNENNTSVHCTGDASISSTLGSSDGAASVKHCVINCMFGGQEAEAEMLRCCLCMSWVHPVCCGDLDKDSSYVGVYTCSKCRTISDRVVSVEAKLDSMIDLNKSLIIMLNDSRTENAELKKLVTNLKNELSSEQNKQNPNDGIQSPRGAANKPRCIQNSSDGKEEHKKWSVSPSKKITPTKLNPLSEEFFPGDRVRIFPSEEGDITSFSLTGLGDNSSTLLPSSAKKKNSKETPSLTVIGNSIVRDCGPILSKELKSVKTSVLSTSGYTVDDAIKNVPNEVTDLNAQDTLIFQLGSVDVQHSDPFVIASKYGDLVDNIRRASKSCNIVILSVPYRLNASSINKNIDSLNSSLRLVCHRDHKCYFWDVNPTAIEKNYRSDGLHFCRKGTLLFAERLVEKFNQSSHFLKSSSNDLV